MTALYSAIRIAGLIYTTLSLTLLPVALIVMLVFLAGFEERGSQSQGLPALVAIYTAILIALGVNTIIAGCLSFFVAGVRPSKGRYLVTLISVMVLGGSFLFWIAAGPSG